MKILGLLVGAALLVGAQSAYAVTIKNGSFENPTISGNSVHLAAGSGDLNHWDVGGAGVDQVREGWQPSAGAQSIGFSTAADSSISQDLHLHIGQTYTVSFDMAGNPNAGPDIKNLFVSVSGKPTLEYFFDTSTQSTANMGWVTTFTYVFIASANTGTLRFLSGTGAALDNVSITPIPGALLLFGSALGGMGFLGYRRKKLEAAA